MLIPREQPYLDGLNSYYLHLDKFVEHMQGEIGSGCLYFRSSTEEILIYFDEREVLRGVVQDNNQRAWVSPTLAPVLSELRRKNFRVTVYTLAASAIFFWGQMPQFQRAKTTLKSADITLSDFNVEAPVYFDTLGAPSKGGTVTLALGDSRIVVNLEALNGKVTVSE